ncbi:MAG: aminopeptidase [Candidatus Eremiobacteraeota bacterium]|nr:aminopeptidase [Candidatus Eremiobacteraeota bacterium]
MALTNTLEYGAMQAVKNCVRVAPGEKVVLITDRDTKHIAGEIYRQLETVTPGNTRMFIMEDFGDRPDDGSAPLHFPAEIAKAMEEEGVTVSFYAARGKKGELPSFRSPMIKIAERRKLRHGHMPNITDLLMTTGMAVDYAKVQEISRKVFEMVKKARFIKVTTPSGTDFTAEFHPGWRWLVSDGHITAEKWSNLPDGEVFTCVYRIPEGKIVVDGVLGDYFCEKYGVLEETPVTLQVKDGRVTDVQCKNGQLLKELTEYMKQDENANRIGEFAIGTNIGLDRLVGNLLQDEKFPGIHIAIGHGYPEKTGSDWNSEAHVDGVMKNPTIIVDGTPLMERGKFLLE